MSDFMPNVKAVILAILYDVPTTAEQNKAIGVFVLSEIVYNIQ